MRFDRLRECITALRAADPENFDMGEFWHECGTPACVLGHHEAYFNRNLFKQLSTGKLWSALRYFEISLEQYYELFAQDGCGKAVAPDEAIAYIERFIIENGGSLSDPLESLKRKLSTPDLETV